MNLTEYPGGVAPPPWAPLAESTALREHLLCSAPTESKKASCSFPCPCFCWHYFLPIGNCGCCVSHLSLGTGRMLQAARLGWACCVITGSSWPWKHEFLLQSSYNREDETAFPLVIQKWVIPHAVYKIHSCSASLFPSLFLMFLEYTASPAGVGGEIDS